MFLDFVHLFYERLTWSRSWLFCRHLISLPPFIIFTSEKESKLSLPLYTGKQLRYICYAKSMDSHHLQILLCKAWISALHRRSEDNLRNLCTCNRRRGQWPVARAKRGSRSDRVVVECGFSLLLLSSMDRRCIKSPSQRGEYRNTDETAHHRLRGSHV